MSKTDPKLKAAVDHYLATHYIPGFVKGEVASLLEQKLPQIKQQLRYEILGEVGDFLKKKNLIK